MPVDESVNAFFLESWTRFGGALDAGTYRLVVGVSGGPDSVALLNAILASGVINSDRIVAAHLNHCLRKEAWEEAKFVGRLAKDLGVTFRHGEVDVAGMASRKGLSVEEAGRIARYHFLAEMATVLGARAIATGHHADDQAETVLMHFLRGSGTAGLRGMSPVASVPGAPDLILIRPLLGVTRADILDYCHVNGLVYRVDPSNTDLTNYRNRLRHALLPQLDRLNPGIKGRLLQTAEIVSADFDLLQELQREAWSKVIKQKGEGWLSFETETWLKLPLSLKRGTLREAVHHLLPGIRDVGFSTIEQARALAEIDEVGSQATLPGGLELAVDYGRLIISTAGNQAPFSMYPQFDRGEAVQLHAPGTVELANGWRLTVDVVDSVELAEVKKLDDRWQAYLSAAACPTLEVRIKRKGERFQPLGMGGHSVKVSDLMINRKIPAVVRERWPLVAGRDHLVWLAGHHIDKRARLTADGQRAIHLQLKRAGRVDLP